MALNRNVQNQQRDRHLPRRSADVIQAISGSEQQLGGPLPSLPRLSVLW